MLSNNELLHTLALQRVPNLGDTSAKKLIRMLGSAEAVFLEKKSSLLKIDGIGRLKLLGLNRSQCVSEAEIELKFLQNHNIYHSYFLDNEYPDKLKHCLDGPILLFHRGNIDIKQKKIISIVGARRVTPQGVAFCEKLVEELAPLQPVIVSGFAYGVDITAQKAAMKNGLQTIGCLAHGLDQIYPKIHRRYVPKVEENGGFFTEFWSNDPFERTNFLKRNRIIAGLSEATVVIESAEKGGSLVTADIANSYHRDVFAVPGRTTDVQSKGCNDLIKSQQAHLLTSAADLIYMLGWELEQNVGSPNQTTLFMEFTSEENPIMEYLKEHGKAPIDNIALDCKTPTHKVASLLLQLELKGAVRPLPGKLFECI